MSQDQSQSTNAKASDSNQIIGKSMWLITKQEMRYEGVLYEVDRVNKTMTLRQVRNMGTEGRRKGENEVEGSDKPLGTVKFRVELIKNFKVLKENEEQPTSKENEPELDPAIVETEPVGNNEGNNNDSNSPGDTSQQNQSSNNTSQQKGPKPARQQVSESKQADEPKQKPTRDLKVQNQTRSAVQRNTNDTFSQKVGKDQADFDFENRELKNPQGEGDGAGNEGQNDSTEDRGTEQLEVKKQETGQSSQKPKYDKNQDFFDDITNSTLEPLPKRGNFRGNRGDRGGGRGGYRGNNERGGGNRGRGNRNYHTNEDGNREGNWSRRGNRYHGEDNRRGGYDDNRRGGYEGRKYSDKLQDPNDPNYYGKSEDDGQKGDGKGNDFFDRPKTRGGHEYGRGRGNRGDRGGHERGGFQKGDFGRKDWDNNRPNTAGRGQRRQGGQERQDKRDEETFGQVSSQNFRFSHENQKSNRKPYPKDKHGQKDNKDGGHGIFGKGMGSNHHQKYKDDDNDDNNGFYDQKKKNVNSQRSNNRFAGIDSKKKREKRVEEDKDSDDEGQK